MDDKSFENENISKKDFIGIISGATIEDGGMCDCPKWMPV